MPCYFAKQYNQKLDIYKLHLAVNKSSLWFFQSTGSHFLDFSNIKLDADERPEDLYQRLMSFTEDSLLVANGNIIHHGDVIAVDEEMTPTLENMVVLTWLSLVHRDLPNLVKQCYGTELRSRTLASLRPEISQALDSLLAEIETAADTKVLRASLPFQENPYSPLLPTTPTIFSSQQTSQVLPLVQTSRAQ